MDRRRFLVVLAAAGASVAYAPHLARRTSPLDSRSARPEPRRRAHPALPRKHWAWVRGNYKSLDDWRRLLATVRKGGIEAVLVTGTSELYRTYVPAAKDEGVEVHAWIMAMMRGEHVATHPEWYAVSREGVSTADKPPYVPYYRFMCPSRDEVKAWLVGYVRELAQIDGLASIHLDYIRYPDVILPVALWPKYKIVQDREYPPYDFCYCRVCRDRFKQQSGRDPLQLPDPATDKAWLQYRYDSITHVVHLVAEEVHRHRKQVTAAVFPTPGIARALVRQNWPEWKIDAILPMAYHAFYKEDVTWIERATREGVESLGGRRPLYSGLYVPDLPPVDLARAARYALAGGASGICLFQGNTLTPEHWAALTPVLEGRS